MKTFRDARGIPLARSIPEDQERKLRGNQYDLRWASQSPYGHHDKRTHRVFGCILELPGKLRAKFPEMCRHSSCFVYEYRWTHKMIDTYNTEAFSIYSNILIYVDYMEVN